jgi:hypothetical protein
MCHARVSAWLRHALRARGVGTALSPLCAIGVSFADVLLMSPPVAQHLGLPCSSLDPPCPELPSAELVEAVDDLQYCWDTAKVAREITQGLYNLDLESPFGDVNFSAYAQGDTWPCTPQLASSMSIVGRRGMMVGTTIQNTWSTLSDCGLGLAQEQACSSTRAQTDIPGVESIIDPNRTRTSPRYFVANVEQYWVQIYQSFTSGLVGDDGTPFRGSSTSGWIGKLYLPDDAKCAKWAAAGLSVSDPKAPRKAGCLVTSVRAEFLLNTDQATTLLLDPGKPFRPGYDYLPLLLLLDAAQVDLDAAQTTDSDTISRFLRKAGARLQLTANYSNWQDWGQLEMNPRNVDIIYGMRLLDVGASQLQPVNQYVGNKTDGTLYFLRTSLSGVLISFVQVGRFGEFDFFQMMNVLVAGYALAASAAAAVIALFLSGGGYLGYRRAKELSDMIAGGAIVDG